MKTQLFLKKIHISFLIFGLLIILPIQTFAEQNYENQLIQSANELKLHQKRYWHLLLHYKKNIFGNYTSEIDGKDFFLSKEGKTNPKLELEQTIRSFFQAKPEGENVLHPQCKYPARYKWLKEKLNFDENLLKEIHCERFVRWKNSLNPKGITLVFSSYYMNAPASMFGHTLFKIDSKQNVGHELLDYGINFAAGIGGETNPIIYAYKGLFGLFPGNFSIFPYYLKVNEYNDLESRDMWEYEMNLKQDESERFLLHLWELGGTYFDYYFFDENCSYRLLHLLEVSRPSLRLVNKTKFIVAPSDTIKIYLNEEGLVTTRNYRPSLYSKIKQKLVKMTKEERKLYNEILKTKRPFHEYDFDEKKRTLIVDAILDTYRYRKLADTSDEDDKKKYRNYLLERSQMNEEYALDEKNEMTTPPDYSHGMSRVYLGGGTSNIGNFWEASYRIGYHDLMNNDKGHVPNSEVQFLNLNIRQYDNEKDKSIQLNSLDVVKLYSFTPYNSTAELNSYILDIGIDSVMNKDKYPRREEDYILFGIPYQNFSTPSLYGLGQYYRNKQDSTNPYKIHPVNLSGAYGYSFQNEYDEDLKPYMVSILPGFKSQYHSKFVNNLRYAPTLTFSFIASFSQFKMQLLTSYYLYTVSGNFNDYSARLRFRYSLHKNHEIRLEFNSQRYYKEARLAYHYLF